MAEKEIVMNGTGIEEIGFPGWPKFAPETFEDVLEPLRQSKVNYWTGTKGMEFEEMFAKWMNAKMAISCTNGTAALHIALASLGIGPGDEVIVPSYSFIASSFSVVQAGAIPVFADVTDDHTKAYRHEQKWLPLLFDCKPDQEYACTDHSKMLDGHVCKTCVLQELLYAF